MEVCYNKGSDDDKVMLPLLIGSGMNPMDLGTLLGFAAGILTTIAFWPQLCRTWKTRSADDLSLGMLITFTTGVFLWLLYGLYINAWPIILANLITLVLTLAILVLRIRY